MQVSENDFGDRPMISMEEFLQSLDIMLGPITQDFGARNEFQDGKFLRPLGGHVDYPLYDMLDSLLVYSLCRDSQEKQFYLEEFYSLFAFFLGSREG